MPTRKRDGPVKNRLLAALPKKEYQHLLPELEEVTLTFGDILFEPSESIRHVFFPNDSIISLLSAVEDRAMLEWRVSPSSWGLTSRVIARWCRGQAPP